MLVAAVAAAAAAAAASYSSKIGTLLLAFNAVAASLVCSAVGTCSCI